MPFAKTSETDFESAPQAEELQGIHVSESCVIHRPAAELFRFWRDFENLPQFMTHLDRVTVTSGTRSHWVIQGPLGRRMEWDAEIVQEEPDRLIAWHSLAGADIPNAGRVRFEESETGETEVQMMLEYVPPAGALGRLVARLAGGDLAQQIREDLQRFKQLMEKAE